MIIKKLFHNLIDLSLNKNNNDIFISKIYTLIHSLIKFNNLLEYYF